MQETALPATRTSDDKEFEQIIWKQKLDNA